jgi:hypothetical protein
MWNRRSIWAVAATAAAVAVAVVSLNMLGLFGGPTEPFGRTGRSISTRLIYDPAEFAALGGEPVADDADLYEVCALPAQCHCWGGQDPVPMTQRDGIPGEWRGRDKHASTCRVLRPWWGRLWRTVSP